MAHWSLESPGRRDHFVRRTLARSARTKVSSGAGHPTGGGVMLSLRRAGSVVGCVLGFVALLAYGCSDETSSGTTTKGSSSTASGTPAGSGAAGVGGGG